MAQCHSSVNVCFQVARAGRFGTKGLAITFVSDENDAKILNEVQERFEVNITELPDEIDISSYSKLPPNLYIFHTFSFRVWMCLSNIWKLTNLLSFSEPVCNYDLLLQHQSLLIRYLWKAGKFCASCWLIQHISPHLITLVFLVQFYLLSLQTKLHLVLVLVWTLFTLCADSSTSILCTQSTLTSSLCTVHIDCHVLVYTKSTFWY